MRSVSRNSGALLDQIPRALVGIWGNPLGVCAASENSLPTPQLAHWNLIILGMVIMVTLPFSEFICCARHGAKRLHELGHLVLPIRWLL